MHTVVAQSELLGRHSRMSLAASRSTSWCTSSAIRFVSPSHNDLHSSVELPTAALQSHILLVNIVLGGGIILKLPTHQRRPNDENNPIVEHPKKHQATSVRPLRIHLILIYSRVSILIYVYLVYLEAKAQGTAVYNAFRTRRKGK